MPCCGALPCTLGNRLSRFSLQLFYDPFLPIGQVLDLDLYTLDRHAGHLAGLTGLSTLHELRLEMCGDMLYESTHLQAGLPRVPSLKKLLMYTKVSVKLGMKWGSVLLRGSLEAVDVQCSAACADVPSGAIWGHVTAALFCEQGQSGNKTIPGRWQQG